MASKKKIPMKKVDSEKVKAIEERVYENLLKDFGRMYFESNGRIPAGTYVAPINCEELPIIIAFFEKKGFHYSTSRNGFLFVRFPEPKLSL